MSSAFAELGLKWWACAASGQSLSGVAAAGVWEERVFSLGLLVLEDL